MVIKDLLFRTRDSESRRYDRLSMESLEELPFLTSTVAAGDFEEVRRKRSLSH